MYKSPKFFIINKQDMERIKANASSTGLKDCFGSGECSGGSDHAGACTSSPSDNHGSN